MSLDIDTLLVMATDSSTSKWELDNIVYHERLSNPAVLLDFLRRIKELKALDNPSPAESQELEILEGLAEDMDQDECEDLLSQDDEIVRQRL